MYLFNLRCKNFKRGYKPYVQTEGTIGAFRTAEDVTSEIIRYEDQNTSWQNLMRDNDMNEGDWEIDELKPITTYVDNRIKVVVTTISLISRLSMYSF